MLTNVTLLICVVMIAVLVFALRRAITRIYALEDSLEGLLEHAFEVFSNVESRINEEDHVSNEVQGTSDFDARIAQLRDELDNPTYPRNVAQTYHPGVYNLPHDTVEDVPLKYEAPEFAE